MTLANPQLVRTIAIPFSFGTPAQGVGVLGSSPGGATQAYVGLGGTFLGLAGISNLNTDNPTVTNLGEPGWVYNWVGVHPRETRAFVTAQQGRDGFLVEIDPATGSLTPRPAGTTGNGLGTLVMNSNPTGPGVIEADGLTAFDQETGATVPPSIPLTQLGAHAINGKRSILVTGAGGSGTLSLSFEQRDLSQPGLPVTASVTYGGQFSDIRAQYMDLNPSGTEGLATLNNPTERKSLLAFRLPLQANGFTDVTEASFKYRRDIKYLSDHQALVVNQTDGTLEVLSPTNPPTVVRSVSLGADPNLRCLALSADRRFAYVTGLRGLHVIQLFP